MIPGFGDFVDRIYPIELKIKDTTDTDRSVLYIDLHLNIDSKGRLRTKIYDKRDYLNFSIANFQFICSTIPAAPAYGVYISQLIQYSRDCGPYAVDRAFPSSSHINAVDRALSSSSHIYAADEPLPFKFTY
jgi:hypothetical protein